MLILEKIRQIVLAQLGEAKAESEMGFDDNLWDWGVTSITSVGIVVKVEDSFGIEFPEEYLSRQALSTVRSIGAAVSAASGGALEDAS